MFELVPTALPEVKLIRPRRFQDARGFLSETYHAEKFARLGIDDRFVQDNHSRSQRGTLRGLHFQLRHPQSKLCRVVSGEVLDVAVDIRVGSPTFGQHVAALLSADNGLMIYVPRGFAHGFSVLSEGADFLYKCGDLYRPDDEGGVLYCDPALAIDWRVAEPVLSAKDQAYRPLSAIEPSALPRYRPPGG
jgi:dTDP-4-dehydrorhamnose 3,5-epimerase